jgi:hypothetical protein
MAFNYSSSFNVPRQSSTHGSDCSSNASLSPTSASHPKSANPGTCNMNIHATSSSGISSSCVQMSKTAGQRYTQCMFCKTNGETIQVYGSHSLKDDYASFSLILFRNQLTMTVWISDLFLSGNCHIRSWSYYTTEGFSDISALGPSLKPDNVLTTIHLV